MKRHLVPALLALTVSASAVDVTIVPFDGSPIPIGAGARALGMGGAFTAVADDATANTWNPAGMAQLERPELSLNGGFYARTTSTDGEDASTDTAVSLDHVSAVLPFFVLGTQQTVGVAWQRQFDFTRELSSQTRIFAPGQTLLTQGYSDNHVENDGAWSSLSLSYACDITPTLSFGATVLVWGDRLTGLSYNDRRARSNGRLTTIDQSGPTVLSDEYFTAATDWRVTVDSGTSVVLGTLWHATAEWTLAAVLKPRYQLALDIEQSESQVLTDVTSGAVTSQSASSSRRSATFIYPTSATMGAAWHPNDAQTVTLDATWTDWSALAVEDGGGRFSPISIHVAPEAFADGYALRLGYEHVVLLPRLVVVPRCGLLYEGLPGISATSDNANPQNTHAIVDRYYGATLGLSVFQRRLLYDLAGQVRYGHQVGASIDGPPDGYADVIGYTLRAGVTYHF